MCHSPCFLRSTVIVTATPASDVGLASPLASRRLPSLSVPPFRPLIFKSIVAAAGEGDGVGLGDGVAEGDGVGSPEGAADGEGVGALGLGVGVGDAVALGVGVGVDVGVGVALGVGLGVGVGVGAPATVKLPVLVTVLPEAVTVTGPLVAPIGTVAQIP